ncbi:MAG: sigma-54-dependent Fis family transcriptional regulator, partial [Aquificota bacterium]
MGMEGKVRLLLVDDEPHFCRVMAMHLADEGYIVATATSGEEALERFRGEEYHLVITDLKMPGVDGLVLLERIRDLSAEVPVIVLTAYGTVDTAVQAMKLGAFDYILKPVDVDELKMVVARALRMQEITKENLALKASLSAFYRDFSLVAESKAMQDLFPIIRKASEVDSPLLIRGETGVGKELVARVIHASGTRKEGPFTVVDCASLEPERVEEVLFGGEEGEPGKVHLARGGTLLLDQVDELSPRTQARLLRFLEEERVAQMPRVRVVATTTEDLGGLVEKGSFRRDLFYRLRVLEISIPPLRERKEDIPPLVEHFIKKYNARLGTMVERISSRALDCLVSHSWPGNVRELENVI